LTGQPDRVVIGETIRVGADIKAKLELLARQENADATCLARRVLREYVETRERSRLRARPLESRRAR
jgi:predicted transcriptional regulator